MRANSVDLPAPFGPSSTTKPPRGTVSDTSSSASDRPEAMADAAHLQRIGPASMAGRGTGVIS